MLIAMPVWDTLDNGRTVLTQKVIPQLLSTMTEDDRLVVYDNGSCDETTGFIISNTDRRMNYILGSRNIGIAAAVNEVWRNYAKATDVVCKIDNDCFIHDKGWTTLVEYVFKKQPDIGILGLKRKDLEERPDHNVGFYKSNLSFVKRNNGDRWIPLEEVKHVMGTCYCFNPVARHRIGYLMQPNTVYGFDDSLSSARVKSLGFKTCFLPQVEIDHLDINFDSDNFTVYTKWKQDQAALGMKVYNQMAKDIKSGKLDIYYDGGF